MLDSVDTRALTRSPALNKVRCIMSARYQSCAVVSCVVLSVGCDTAKQWPSTFSPTTVDVDPRSTPNWTASGTVVDVRGVCSEGMSPGQTLAPAQWKVTIDAGSISLDEHVGSWQTEHPLYAGTLAAQQFTAAYHSSIQSVSAVCRLREATLAGRFDSDFSTFDAIETLMWGPRDSETVAQLHWTGSRLP